MQLWFYYLTQVGTKQNISVVYRPFDITYFENNKVDEEIYRKIRNTEDNINDFKLQTQRILFINTQYVSTYN